MEAIAIFIMAIIISVGESLFGAQLVVWGLAQFHVHSGILGPWFILSALSMLMGTAVSQAIKSSKA